MIPLLSISFRKRSVSKLKNRKLNLKACHFGSFADIRRTYQVGLLRANSLHRNAIFSQPSSHARRRLYGLVLLPACRYAATDRTAIRRADSDNKGRSRQAGLAIMQAKPSTPY